MGNGINGSQDAINRSLPASVVFPNEIFESKRREANNTIVACPTSLLGGKQGDEDVFDLPAAGTMIARLSGAALLRISDRDTLNDSYEWNPMLNILSSGTVPVFSDRSVAQQTIGTSTIIISNYTQYTQPSFILYFFLLHCLLQKKIAQLALSVLSAHMIRLGNGINRHYREECM